MNKSVKNKKQGSALVMVIILSSALFIIAAAVSTYVINTIKLNKRYDEALDLELEAKSALNITIENIENEINSNLNNINNEDILNTYMVVPYSKINSKLDSTINHDITISKISSENKTVKYEVESTATYNNMSKTVVKNIDVNIKSGSSSENSKGNILGLLNRVYSGVFENKDSIDIQNSFHFNKAFFVNNDIVPTSGGAYYTGKNVEYDVYDGTGSNVTIATTNNDPWTVDNINLNVPELSLSNSTSTGELILTADGNNDVTLSTDGNYLYIENYNGYRIYICNGDLEIKNTNQWGFTYDQKTIIVVNGSITFKAFSPIEGAGQNQSYLRNLGIMAKSIECSGLFCGYQFFESVLLTKNFSVNSNSRVDLNYNNNLNQYNEMITIINKIVNKEELN